MRLQPRCGALICGIFVKEIRFDYPWQVKTNPVTEAPLDVTRISGSHPICHQRVIVPPPKTMPTTAAHGDTTNYKKTQSLNNWTKQLEGLTTTSPKRELALT